MKKSELFTQEMLETFTCHPYADAPIRYGEGVYLSDVYGSYSDAKESAYNYCKRLCKEFNGRDFRIAGHNCMTFSVQFEFENPLNGCIMLAHITRYNNHLYFK
jgi:hypothetical protein